MNTLWLKTLRDLWLFKSRTILVVLAIAVGTAAAGVATTSFIVLRGDLRSGYSGTNPAHAILDVAGGFSPAISEWHAELITGLPEVDAAEVRRLTPARLLLDGGEERFMQLWTLPAAPAIGALYPQNGAAIPPPDGSVLLERASGSVLGIAVGDMVTIEMLAGDTFRLPVAGFVNDLAVAPTTVQPGVYGYISDDTAALLDLPTGYNQLRLTIAAPDAGQFIALDRAAVETGVTAATEWLEDEGIVVTRADIPEPGVHLMQNSADTGLLMISILGGLTLLLSAFLVANVMSAVIAQQVPIIGVLKALGGGRRLVMWHYGRMVLLFGLMALALAVPLGLFGAWFMSSFLAAELNFDIPSFNLPWPTLLIQIVGALLIPALAAWGPVRAAAGLTIRDAFSQTTNTKAEVGDKKDVPPYFLARMAYLVPWRNIARRRLRLVLTLVALSLAGALFIATFGLRLGLYEAIEILVGEFPYDVQIDFAASELAQRVERESAAVEGIERAEVWGVAEARRIYPDGRLGSSFTIYGVPATTEIAAFANRDGRWLAPDDAAAVYISYETEKLTAQPRVGEGLALKFNGVRDQTAQLVGISLRPFNAEAYMPYAEFEDVTGARGRANRVVVYIDGDDPARQAAIAAELVARYEMAGMPVLRVDTAAGFRQGYTAQFNNLIVLLMSLAGLTALVGGLGLANTMAINVLERSREIGILRAMGAGRPLLRRLVLAEGLAIALISAFFGVLLALPLTAILDRVMGGTLLGSPLRFAFSPAAALAWLALVVMIGLVSCWIPAEAASRMTIQRALAYE